LCAFAINEDGADKLSSAPFSNFLDPPLASTIIIWQWRRKELQNKRYMSRAKQEMFWLSIVYWYILINL